MAACLLCGMPAAAAAVFSHLASQASQAGQPAKPASHIAGEVTPESAGEWPPLRQFPPCRARAAGGSGYLAPAAGWATRQRLLWPSASAHTHNSVHTRTPTHPHTARIGCVDTWGEANEAPASPGRTPRPPPRRPSPPAFLDSGGGEEGCTTAEGYCVQVQGAAVQGQVQGPEVNASRSHLGCVCARACVCARTRATCAGVGRISHRDFWLPRFECTCGCSVAGVVSFFKWDRSSV